MKGNKYTDMFNELVYEKFVNDYGLRHR